jgi:hypothetical protein
VLAAQQLRAAGLASAARALEAAAVPAFLHGLAASCLVAGGVAVAGLVLVAVALPGPTGRDPSRRRAPRSAARRSTRV